MRKLVSNKMVNRKLNASVTERCPVAAKAVRELKREMRQQYAGRFADLHLLDLTLREAESMAWETTFPHLFFPVLAEEKVARSIAWTERQRAVKAATSEFCFAA